MSFLSSSRTILLLVAALRLVPAVAAAEPAIDFERTTPVPENTPIPAGDFFRPPLFRSPVLNASGTYFAALVDTGNDHTALLMCDLQKMALKTLRGAGDKDISSVRWLDEGHVIMNLIQEKRYASGLFVAAAENLSDNYMVDNFDATEVVGVPRAAPMRPLVWIYRGAYDDGKDQGMFQLDAKKKLGQNKYAFVGSYQESLNRAETDLYKVQASVARQFDRPPGGDIVESYLPDKNGELAFAITVRNGDYTLYRYTKGSWVKSPADINQVDIFEAGDEPDELIVAGPRDEGKTRPLQRLDAVTGQLGEIVLQDKAYDLVTGSVYRHPVTGNILGVHFYRSGLQTAWFDESYRSVQKALAAQLPGQAVRILGSDTAQQRFFVAAYSDRQPVAYYLMDLKAGSLALIKRSAPWIDPKRMQPMNIFKFKTRDGHQLEGYLTLPAGTSKQNPAPLVVLPHGGPHVRDFWGFDPEAQFLANRGYAVLQPNYRGSTGYTWMFPGDFWAFRKMHDDVTDATKAVLASGLIDAHRVAIMGGSFGGFLAICGVAYEPDLYRCAVTVAGVFDWEAMIRSRKYEQYENAAYGIFRRELGDPSVDAAKLAALSPLHQADKIHVPVFVAHGTDDPIVDVQESEHLISALTKAGVSHEVMLVSGEGHGMLRAAHDVELYTRVEAFLAKNLAPAGAAK